MLLTKMAKDIVQTILSIFSSDDKGAPARAIIIIVTLTATAIAATILPLVMHYEGVTGPSNMGNILWGALIGALGGFIFSLTLSIILMLISSPIITTVDELTKKVGVGKVKELNDFSIRDKQRFFKIVTGIITVLTTVAGAFGLLLVMYHFFNAGGIYILRNFLLGAILFGLAGWIFSSTASITILTLSRED